MGFSVIAHETDVPASYWMTNPFKILLPEHFKFMALGMPALVMLIAIVCHAMWNNQK